MLLSPSTLTNQQLEVSLMLSGQAQRYARGIEIYLLTLAQSNYVCW